MTHPRRFTLWTSGNGTTSYRSWERAIGSARSVAVAIGRPVLITDESGGRWDVSTAGTVARHTA